MEMTNQEIAKANHKPGKKVRVRDMKSPLSHYITVQGREQMAKG